MKRALKIVFGLFGTLLLLLVVAAVGAVLFIDPNDYRDTIAERVEEQTGRKLAIEGEIQLSLFPWLGLELGAMELGNAEGFADKPFARIEGAEARVKLLPLIKLQTEIDTVTLRGLVLNLHRRADGVSNWDDLAKGEAAPVPEEEVPPAETDEQKLEQILAVLAIGGIALEEANVEWRDELNKQHFALNHFNFSSGEIRIGQAIPIKLTTDLFSAAPAAEGKLSFSGDVSADPMAQRYGATGIQLSTEMSGKGLPGGSLALSMAGDASVDLIAQTANLSRFNLNGMGASVGAQLEVSKLLGQPEVEGELRLKLSDIAPLLALAPAGTVPPDLDLTALNGTELDSKLVLSMAQQTFALTPLNLAAPGMKMKVTAKGKQFIDSPDLAAQLDLQLADVTRLLKVFPKEALPAGYKPAALNGSELHADVAFAMAGQSLTLNLLKLNAPGMKVKVTAKGKQVIDNPDVTAKLNLQLAEVTKVLKVLPEGSIPPDIKLSSLNGSDLQANLAFSMADQRLSVAPLNLAAAGLKVKVTAKGEKVIDNPVFSGKLSSNEFVPRKLLSDLGVALPEMADPAVLGKAKLATRFEGGLDRVALRDLDLRFDDTRLNGRASVSKFSTPVIRYKLNLDNIDADRYLPPPEEESAAGKKVAAGAKPAAGKPDEAATELPLDLLRSLDIDGTLTVGKVKVMNLHSNKILATLKAKKGKYKVHPLSAKLYKGGYSGNLGFDVSGKVAKLSMDEKLNGVQSGPLLKDFMGKEYVTGKANLAAKLTARGLEPMAVRKSLNGKVNFKFENGAVNGLNIGQLIRNAYATYKKQPKPPEEKKSTDFANISGSAKVKNGLVSVEKLNARSPLFQVKGSGNVNLVNEKLNLRLATTIVSDMKDATGQRMGDLKGEKIPITIKGSFSEPKYGVDVASVLKAKAKAKIEREKKAAKAKMQKKLDEEKKELEKDLEKKLKDMLKF